MPLEKLETFTKKVGDLADKPNQTMSAAQVKAQFDAAPDEVRVYFNQLIDDLQSVVDGDSGADNINVTAIAGLTGTTVQSLLEALKALTDTKSNSLDVYTKTLLDGGQLDNRYYTETELQSAIDSASGADKVGATPIATSPSTVQGILEWLKSQMDSTVLGQFPDGSITDVKLSDAPTEIKTRFSEHKVDGTAHGVNLKADKIQEAWITPTLLNGWLNFGGAFDEASYMKDSLGFVHIKGLVQSGSAASAIFNLPPGYRPIKHLSFVTTANDAIGRVTITSTGNVTCSVGSTQSFSISLSPFLAGQ
jgi:hypothetical protein